MNRNWKDFHKSDYLKGTNICQTVLQYIKETFILAIHYRNKVNPREEYLFSRRRYSAHSYYILLALDKLIPGVKERSRHAVSRANMRF